MRMFMRASFSFQMSLRAAFPWHRPPGRCGEAISSTIEGMASGYRPRKDISTLNKKSFIHIRDEGR